MKSLLELSAGNTHLYPGARLTAPEAATWSDRSTDAVVLFSDDSRAAAVLNGSDSGLVLGVEAYTTAAGTHVEAKSWLLTDEGSGAIAVKRRA